MEMSMAALAVMLMLMIGGVSCTESAALEVVLQVLTAFKQGLTSDPHGALASWDVASNHSSNPCSGTWAGLQCDYTTAVNDNTTIIITNINIHLQNKSLQGSITPQLSRLSAILASLDLSYNSFSGPLTFLSNFSSSDAALQALTLDYNHLQGPFTLPPSCFPHLRSLSIAENSISGGLPSEALSRCPSLQLLNVSNNIFIGPLFPFGLGNLTTLVKLDAGRNNFSGPIPPSIGNCSKLTFLSLTYNKFSGGVPSSIGRGCPDLEFFTVFQNGLSGQLPPEIGLLSKLYYLSLGLNSFNGEILSPLANCSALVTFDVSKMNMTGEIPVDFGSRHPKIEFMNMEQNMFTGSIPESLGNCSSLQYLLMGFNGNISGTIPPALFRARYIMQLDLQFNFLSGNIPTEIKNLSSLQKTFLNNNKFTGSLPEELGMLASLQVLTLEHNSLSGNFPNQLFNCTNLLGLSLHDNSLAGPISSSIGRLVNLGSFNASSNKLTGELPLGLSNCTKLQSFSLGNNMLSGEIPSTVVTGLIQCMDFDISHNNLSGPIPNVGFLGKDQLQKLDLSHNKLSGAVPSVLAECHDLQLVDLSQNNLAGSVSSALGLSLLNLVELNLSHNSINGSIPTNLSALQSLQRLDLSFNDLSGTIPPALAQIKGMQFLNLSYNSRLEGLIPTGGIFKNLTSTSFLGDSLLCGAVINKACRRSKSASKLIIIGVAVAALVSALFILGIIAIVLVLHRKTRTKYTSNWDFNPYLRLKLEDIQEATGNFSEDNILGAGVTGTVYKGFLKDGTTLAFKKFKLDNTSIRSFISELESVGKIRHRNLVRIMGYYSNQLDTSILILEYMPNGSLEDHLHGGSHPEGLSWEARLQVAISVAQGLVYLHDDSPAPVIHCDLKPQNILFDASMEAHITDFGLAKVMASAATSSFTDNMGGTLGYMAPELASFGHISRKCDVYSYGILLMQLISGRRPHEEVQDMYASNNKEDIMQGTKTLAQWIASMCEANEIIGVVDGRLQAQDGNEIEQIQKLLALALQCAQENPRQRPTMKHVMETLLSVTSTNQVPSNSQVLKDILSSDKTSFIEKDSQVTSFDS